MFSGKTEELIRRIKRARIAGQKVELFKPQLDNRYSEQEVVSHDLNSLIATNVNASAQILLFPLDADVVAIDEAQFLDNELVHVCDELANRGIRVIVAGLDKDFMGKPFGPIPELLAIAEYVSKIHAICVNCGELASFSFRTSPGTDKIMLGEKESYKPLCRLCYNTEMKTRNQ